MLTAQSRSGEINAFLNKQEVADKMDRAIYKAYPSGLLLFSPQRVEEYGGVGWINDIVASPDRTFSVRHMVNGRSEGRQLYTRYQQFHKGIEVEHHGYTIITDGGEGPEGPYFKGTGTGPGPGPVVCARVQGLTANVLSTGSLSINPMKTPQQASVQLVKRHQDAVINSSKLLISVTDKGLPYLAYKISYLKGGPRVAYVNAVTGSITTDVAAETHIDAPTPTYGVQDIDDSPNPNGPGLWLESNDGRVRTHTFPNGSEGVNGFQPGSVPVTEQDPWPDAAIPHVYQAHFATTQCLPVFDDLGLNFNQVFAGAHDEDGAGALWASDIGGTSFVQFGNLGGSNTALLDVVAHELGHCLLYEFVPGSVNPGPRTIHEGFADIIGTYIEGELQQNGVDWIMGDDEPAVGNSIDRNLATSTNKCWLTVRNETTPHQRSLSMSHWFYLTVFAGSADATGIGMRTTVDLVLDAIALLNASADMIAFRDATVATAEMTFGACSREYRAVVGAWEEVCLGGNEPQCLAINGPRTICDDRTSQIRFCVAEDTDNTNGYQWLFPIEWTVQGAQGNSYFGQCLTITDLPEYSSYPVDVEVSVRRVGSPGGAENEFTRRVRIVDCGSPNDPGCSKTNITGSGYSAEMMPVEDEKISIGRSSVFSIDGKLLLSVNYDLNTAELSFRNQYSFSPAPGL